MNKTTIKQKLRFSLLSMLVMFFGGLAHAADPEVTLDFTKQDNWNIPTSGTNTDEATFTDGTYSIKLYAETNYKLNSGYLILGKKGSYLELPAFTFDVEKIEVVGTSSGSASVKQNVYVGDVAVSTETTGVTTSDKQSITNTYEIASDFQGAGNIYRLVVTSGHNTQISQIHIYKKADASDNRIVTTMKIDGESAIPTNAEVGNWIIKPAAIVYGPDGMPIPSLSDAIVFKNLNETVAEVDNEKGQITFIAPGEASFSFEFAGNDEYQPSSVGFKVTVKAAPYTAFASLQENATSTSTPITIQFNGQQVVYVNGSNAFLADNMGNGLLVYTKDHGLLAGEILTGSMDCNLTLYQGNTEITSFSKEGLTITEAPVEARGMTVGTILKEHQSTLVSLMNVTYNKEAGTLSDTEGSITFYDKFKTNVALEDGKVYNITGIVVLYNDKIEICPRTVDDVVAVQTEEPEQYVYRDFAVNLTNAEVIPTTSTSFGVKIAEDGTYTAVAADDATANFTVNAARWNDGQHGWVNCTFTIPVPGPVLIKLGDCEYGAQTGTIVDSEGNVTELSKTVKKCWDPNKPDENVIATYYRGLSASTLTISYEGYCPFISVKAISPDDLPAEVTEYTVKFDKMHAEGTAPAELTVKKGEKITIPANTTLYLEGSTITGWSYKDGVAKAGDEITVTEDLILTPVFTENTVKFADRTAEATLVWQFGEKNGAGTLNAQGGKTILVTQATIGESVIDVKMDIDATNGKINNVGRGDEWAQCNDGTILTIPAYKGTQVSFKSYYDGTGTTIGGADAENKAATYTGTAETLDIVAKGMGYISNVTAVYPVPTGEEPAEFTFRDFAINLVSILTDEQRVEQQAQEFGVAVAEDGTLTQVAYGAANANVSLKGTYWNDHGWTNTEATVKVEGPVQIDLGYCNYGSGDITVLNDKGEVVATGANVSGQGCWSADASDKVATVKYTGEATTLTIKYASYLPYIAMKAIEATTSIEVAYAMDDIECEGNILPTGGTYAAGDEYTIPAQNFTLYKEGYTLTGWSDGTNVYAAGQKITLPNENLILAPVFTKNEVSLADRTEPVTVKWNFRPDQGAPKVGWEGQDGLIWVAQAEVNGKTIDVALPFSTAPGKFNNKSNSDWVQINNGTKFTVPSCKGATISMEAYSDITTTTIDGQTDYTSGKTISYEIASSAESVDVVIGDGSYYRYIQVVLPVVESQGGGESYTNEVATVVWSFNDPSNMSAYTSTPDGVFSTVATNTGDITLNGTGTGQATYPDGSAVSFVKLRPAGSTQAVEWAVKPAAGLTFTPTKISAYIARFGTDAENGITITAKAGEGETITLGNFTAPRNNKSQADDKYGKNSNYTNQFIIELTAEQQAALTSADGLSVFGTVGVASGKDGGYAEMTIEGLINGTVATVNKYTLATTVAPEEAGSIKVYPAADEYEEGSEVKLTATENFGYDFVNWTDAEGAVVSEEPVFTYTMNGDATLTANFKAVETYELALTVDGTNDYMVTVNPEPTIVDGKWMYEAGTTVELIANQYEGLVTFTNWSDGETAYNKIVKMEDNVTLTAVYAEADIIAGWDFYKAGGNGRKADFFAQDNDADALNLVNTETGETQGWLDKSTVAGGGYESFKGAAVNWRTGSGNGDVGNWHWQTKVNAEAFTDINVQFQMLYNYNAYQTYLAEYSLDGETWTKFGDITMSGTKAPASFNETMPEAANNQKELYIRMRADKENSKVDGAASANDGNTLAMFFITGTPKLVDDGKAPELVSTVPADKATGASATGKIVLTFDERVKMAEGAVAYINNTAIDSEMQNPTKGIVSGKTITFEYKGLEYATQYAFILPGNTVSDLTDNTIANSIRLTFTTMERPSVTKGLYDAVVENVDQLVAAIDAAQKRSDKNVRYRIFIKNGEYTIPLGSAMKTVNGYEVPECITFINTQNLSLIGESRDGVIITNGIDKNATFAGTYGTTSKYDGIGNSDVFQISGSDYYFQDLTIESGMDDATGRDLAVQDKATRTIYKNTGLRGYQDTWTSNNGNGLYYFEGGYVRGRTDYMCGKGDAFFNGVELRQIAGGYAAVPSNSIKYGYVYKDCTINGEGDGVDGNYTLGRPWGSGTPSALFIDTKMNVVPSAIGWNEMSGGWPKRFAEYNSTTSTGSVIDLSGRKKIFADTHENNPVLTAEEALEAGNLHNMFGEWDPTLLTEQAPIPANVKLEGTTLTWDDSNYVLLYAICKDGNVIDFTTDATFTVDDPAAKYSVRAANEMGGLSEAADAETAATSIADIKNSQLSDGQYYNLQGQRVQTVAKGIFIINGKKVVKK